MRQQDWWCCGPVALVSDVDGWVVVTSQALMSTQTSSSAVTSIGAAEGAVEIDTVVGRMQLAEVHHKCCPATRTAVEESWASLGRLQMVERRKDNCSPHFCESVEEDRHGQRQDRLVDVYGRNDSSRLCLSIRGSVGHGPTRGSGLAKR